MNTEFELTARKIFLKATLLFARESLQPSPPKNNSFADGSSLGTDQGQARVLFPIYCVTTGKRLTPDCTKSGPRTKTSLPKYLDLKNKQLFKNFYNTLIHTK